MEAMKDRKQTRATYQANGRALRYYRTREHLTLHGLAEKAGVSFTQISRIETGVTAKPRWSTLMQLAETLGVDVDNLVIHDDPSEFLAPENMRRIEQVRKEWDQRDNKIRDNFNFREMGSGDKETTGGAS